jgi:hypothetical protein
MKLAIGLKISRYLPLLSSDERTLARIRPSSCLFTQTSRVVRARWNFIDHLPAAECAYFTDCENLVSPILLYRRAVVCSRRTGGIRRTTSRPAWRTISWFRASMDLRLSLIALTITIHAMAVVIMALVMVKIRVRLENHGPGVRYVTPDRGCRSGWTATGYLHGMEVTIWGAAYL